MTYSVVTHFDQPNWERFGPNWLRTAKLQGLKGIVVGRDLTDEAQAKISSLGFRHVPFEGNRLKPPCEGLCLLTRPDTLPIGDLPTDHDVVCSIDKDLTHFDIVCSISDLSKRADIIRLFQGQEGVFSTTYILGTKDFWAGFSEFQNYIESQNGFLDGNRFREELLFNLYMGFFKPKVRVKNA